MLFVKDILFLNGAMATMAPDVDILGEILAVVTYFTQHHGDRIAREIGVELLESPIDLDGYRAAMGFTEETDSITFRDLQERRELIRRRLEQRAEGETRPPLLGRALYRVAPVPTGAERKGPARVRWTGPDLTGGTGPDWTAPDWTEPDGTEPDWTEPDGTGLDCSTGRRGPARLRPVIADQSDRRGPVAQRRVTTNSAAPHRALALQQPSDQRRPDHHPVGHFAHRGRLLGRRDADADADRQVGRGPDPGGHLPRRLGQDGPLAGHPHPSDPVDESAGAPADGVDPFRRCRGRHRASTVATPAGSAAARPSGSELLQREVGDDRAGHTGLVHEPGDARVSGPVDEVVVGHHDQRHADVDPAQVGQDPVGRGPTVQGPQRCRLDGRPVDHRIGEGDPDLDGIGPCPGEGLQGEQPAVVHPAGDVGHQRLVSLPSRRSPQGRSPARRARPAPVRTLVGASPHVRGRGQDVRVTWATSLSPRPDRLTRTVVPGGQTSSVRGHAADATQAMAWGRLERGDDPLRLGASRWKASTTSPSLGRTRSGPGRCRPGGRAPGRCRGSPTRPRWRSPRGSVPLRPG